MNNIYLNISEISSLIGYSSYDIIKPFERLWKRSDQKSFERLLNNMNSTILISEKKIHEMDYQKSELKIKLENKKLTKRQFTNEMLKVEKLEKENKKIIENVSSNVDKLTLSNEKYIEKFLGDSFINNASIIDKTNKFNEIKNNNSISEKIKSELLKKTDNIINTTHGITKEDSVIEQFEKKFNIKLDVSQEYYKKRFKDNYFIGGKVDGLLKDQYIVEVKNRVNGFFNTVRDYENVQIQLYLYILDLNEAKLVECYNSKMRITVIYKNTDFINEILESLNIFIDNFKEFLLNVSKKEKYINMDDDSKCKFLNKLYLSKIVDYKYNKIDNSECLIDDLD